MTSGSSKWPDGLPPPPASSVAGRLNERPFLGRDREIARLLEAYREVAAGSGQLALVAGEPGIGKTTVCRELEAAVVGHGAQVVWGGSHQASGAPPFWPWLQAVRQWARINTFGCAGTLSQDHTRELARLFPELSGGSDAPVSWPVSEPASAEFGLFEAFVALLEVMSARAPLVVILEDLHWADGATVRLLEHVARALPRLRLLLVCTYRDTDPSPGDRLSHAFADLHRDPGFVRVVLVGLSREAVREYVCAVGHIDPMASVVELLHDSTGGNPFLLVELVELLIERGSLARARATDLSVPRGVKEALDGRFDRLSPDARQLMLAAAVVGRDFTYDVLASLRAARTAPQERGDASGADAGDRLVELIEEALGSGIIEEAELPGQYRFVHALMQETLLSELSATRRALLHGRVAEALELATAEAPSSPAGQLATHFFASSALNTDHLAKARHYAALAGEQAEHQFAWSDAAHWYRRATENVKDPDPGLLRALANAWVHAHGWWTPGGAPLFVAAIDAYRRSGDRRGVAETVSELPIGYLVLPFAGPALSEAIAAGEAIDVRTQVALWFKLSRRYLLVGQSEASAGEIESCESELLRLANHPDISNGDAIRASVAAYRANRRSDFREAARWFAEAGGVYERLGRPFDVCEGLNWASSRSLACGDLARARLYGEANAQLAAKYRHFSGTIAWLYLWVLGVMQNTKSLSTIVEAGPFPSPVAGAWWTLVRGLRDEALSMLAPADVRSSPLRALNTSAPCAAVRFAAEGPEAAEADFANWATAFRTRVGDPAERSSSFALVAQALVALGDEGLCGEVYDEARHWKNWVSFYTGIGVDAGRGVLALRLGRIDEAREAFKDGVAWAEHEGSPIELARNLAGLARVADAEGNRDQARAWLNRADPLFRRLGAKLYLDELLAHRAELAGGAVRVGVSKGRYQPLSNDWGGEGALLERAGLRLRTPGEGTAAGSAIFPDGLSGREIEVLRLVAAGKSNAEIANDLVIAPATVARHVSNILDKTGLSNRTQAAAYATRHGLYP